VKGKLIDLFKKKDSDKGDKNDKSAKADKSKKSQAADNSEKKEKKGSWFKRIFSKKKSNE
jgi:hypothetical protein